MRLLTKQNRIVFILLLGIIILAVFLRFYNLEEFLPFAGDEGRDMFVAEKIVNGEEFPTLGAPSSAGDFFLGPIYYYFMAFALLLFNHPVAPAFLVAIFSVLTVPLLYFTGKKIHSPVAGLAAAAIYSTSFSGVLFARWSWNPNLLPFFVTAIIFYLALLGSKNPKIKYLVLLFISLGVAIQLHATAFLLIPVVVICLAIWRPRLSKWYTWPASIVTGLIVMLPWVIYEFTHRFTNFFGAFDLLQSEGQFILGERMKYIGEFVFVEINKLLLGNIFTNGLAIVAIIGIILACLIIFWQRKRISGINWFMILLTIFVISFYLFYSGFVFAQYFIILWPIIILILAQICGKLWNQSRVIGKILVVALILGLSYAGIYASVERFKALGDGTAYGEHGVSFKDQQIAVDKISEGVLEEIDLQSQSKNNYFEAYQYLLHIKGIEVNSEAEKQVMIMRKSELEKIVNGTECFGTVCVLIK